MREEAPLPRAAVSITPLRKQALLVEARRNRVEWVDASSPYRTLINGVGSTSSWNAIEKLLASSNGGKADYSSQTDLDSLPGSNDRQPEDEDDTSSGVRDGMDLLRKARACASMKSAVGIVSTLYSGIPVREIEERVARQMMSQLSADDVKSILAGSQLHSQKEREAVIASGLKNLTVAQKAAAGHQVFIQRLRSPEAAELVQGMKYFVSSLENSIQTKLAEQADKSQIASETAASIHTYLDKTTKLLKAHVLWQKDDVDEFELNGKLAMESFLFQKFHKALWSLTCDSEGDKNVGDKIQSLQFITWENFDIKCLSGKDVNLSPDAAPTDLEEGTTAPPSPVDTWSVTLDALRFVDAQWSPTAKLVLFVEAYRGVSATLCAAMSKGELPGADDSLPALILAILHAKPENVVSNLAFVQEFVRPDLLRGEPGYVLTSALSAIQFIMDVKDSSSLTISPGEFSQGLAKCTAEIEKREEKTKKGEARVAERNEFAAGSADLETTMDTKHETSKRSTKGYKEISARDVRAARVQGEDVTLEWALRWQATNNPINEARGTMSQDGSADDERSSSNWSQSRFGPAAVYSLPQGFTRTYSFLGVQPDDIRISDIPTLLDEYHQLVRVCETLLTEKNAELAAEHKRRLKMARDQLESDAAAAAVNVPWKSSTDYKQVSS